MIDLVALARPNAIPMEFSDKSKVYLPKLGEQFLRGGVFEFKQRRKALEYAVRVRDTYKRLKRID